MGVIDSTTKGWRVLAVDPRGPCGMHDIIPFFEYIVAVNGKRLHNQGTKVMRSLAWSNKKRTWLTLLNYKTSLERKLEIYPNKTWGGAGLLGLIIVKDDPDTADRRAVRVVSVTPESLADKAGLQPSVDFILGTESFVFTGWSGFLRHMKDHNDAELRLRVYNSRLCELREVKIQSMDQDLLGFELGSGQLHTLPDILPGTFIRADKSLAVEISKGCAGILAAPMEDGSNKESADPISVDDMYLTIGDPIGSMYDEKILAKKE